ncbi:HypC/HybG/HupF family hydrogenase formation chaperone [Patescibacteria group bacterium]|nr:HypC/HybG/HupF family hydrogenase formation chaperone [Patescibacteria group bacterium]
MCLATPGKIIKTNKEKAIVDFNGIQKEINISLVKIKVGDYVMVHAGFAIEKIENKKH